MNKYLDLSTCNLKPYTSSHLNFPPKFWNRNLRKKWWKYILPDRHKDVWLFKGGVLLVTVAVNIVFVVDFRLLVTLFNELIGLVSKNPPATRKKNIGKTWKHIQIRIEKYILQIYIIIHKGGQKNFSSQYRKIISLTSVSCFDRKNWCKQS